MTPRPEEASTKGDDGRCADGDRVVISGMAGLYPQARYVTDLENILYNKVNPVSSEGLRWKYNHPEVAQYTGNIPDLNRFDAQFFKVHYRLGNNMDSMSRKILEQTFEAIYDAGISPEHLSGKKVGVYIGTCFSESEKAFFYVASSRSGFGVAGCSKAMFANRISYWLNAKGPSVSIDEACCSSTAALDAAYRDISRGECEAAIVGGANLCLHPQSSVHYSRIMNISKDECTKSFCEDAEGCTKSEAINVLFLQKAKYAKRIYAEVIHVKCEFVSIMKGDTGPRYGFYREPADTAEFIKTFYEEAGVAPGDVEYVEAFGSAVPEVDKSELEAIDKVFCNEREEPLLVGSVMSNIGYGEAASGISAVTKVLLGFHKGSLAGNLHCSAPRRDVAALREGRLRVLADHAQFRRTYAAVNSLAVTGVNAHVLLHGRYKRKDLDRYKTDLPRLVAVSGRHEPAVKRMLDLLASHPVDPEELALLYNIHETNITGHLGKGYTILSTGPEGETVSRAQRVEFCDGAKRPLWFVYSGMGSQWAGMGAQLMRIPIFAAAIERCRAVLEPKGIDIVHIVTSSDKTIFDNILHSFVGIAAVQIGLTDVLLQLGLVPDKIIGHSVGELGCAYADGCLTAEEMILSAYSRGRVSLETPFIRGSMAAVGVGAKQMSSMCPSEIEIACHNSAESCTISGPADAMRSFVADLTSRGIFAKEVPCSNIAYHSRYIAEAGPGLLKYLKEVIRTPRARSERWVSSSVPQDRWGELAAQYSSAEYHTNNLLSPVLFEETSALIPADAVLVEVAPHGLLQAILKRALPASVDNVPLTRRGHADNVVMLLDAIGKLYLHGYYPKVRVLYPAVEFPVSTGTPLLSHYVEWAHQEKWVLPLYQSAHRKIAASCTFVVSIYDADYSYLKGHTIKDKTLLPFSFALVAAWDTLAMSLNAPKKSLDVQFRDVKLFTQPILHEQRAVRLTVTLHRGNGWFEVMNEASTVATGFIIKVQQVNLEKLDPISQSHAMKINNLETSQLYQVLNARGYNYSGAFRAVHSADENITEGALSWNDNWVTFIDGLIQLNTLKYTHSGVSLPDRIGSMAINVSKHIISIQVDTDSKKTRLIDAQLSEVQNRTRSGGVVIENMSFREVFQMNEADVTLQALKFVPRFQSNIDRFTALNVLLQIAAENTNKEIINVLGFTNNPGSRLFENMKKIVESGIPNTKIEYREIAINNILEKEREYRDVDLILIENLSKQENMLQSLQRILPPNKFVVNEEVTSNAQRFSSEYYKVVSALKNNDTRLELAYWRPAHPAQATSTLTVRSESELPLLKQARDLLQSSQNCVTVLTSYPPVAGLISLVQKWRKEVTLNRIQVIMTNDVSDDILEQIPDLLHCNIFNKGIWGGEYYLPIEEKSTKEVNNILQCGVIGDLDSLKWVKIPEITGSNPIVKVHYAGLNMGDVLRAHGQYRPASGLKSNNKYLNYGFGMDYSGITKSGERVMGVAVSGAARSVVAAAPELSWPVPPHWTLEDAATVPFAYLYAYYCLVIKTSSMILPKGTTQFTVLIHGGAGALGQACISVALARGWRVFTTVADVGKKRFLAKLFPELNERYICNSRDASFKDYILNETNGVGCNMVLCCVKGELRDVSFKCCALSGLLLDTVQIISNEDYTFGMNNLNRDMSYAAIDIAILFENAKSQKMQVLHSLVNSGIASGEVRPLTRVTFAADEAARAFRLLAASRHRGRALLRLRDSPAPATPRVSSENAPCHVIVGGADSLALDVAEKCIDRGIKKLHFHFNAPADPHVNYRLSLWKKQESEITVTSGYLNEDNLHDYLLKSATALGPIEAIYIILEKTIPEIVIKKLELATRTSCTSLEYFMLISQDNNTEHYKDLCVQRTKRGFPATFLDLSMLKTVASWSRRAAAAVQRAWSSGGAALVASTRPHSQTLLQRLAALTDLNILETSTSDASLEELGMPLEKSAAISILLRDLCNYALHEEDIPKLTIERIKEIEKLSVPPRLEAVSGLGMFFSHVDPDELLATTDMVLMSTLTHTNSMRDDEFDASETFLCIVPGLEGHHARFRTLCERLKLPALVLQPGLDHPDHTPKQLAARYAQVLLTKAALKKTFYILGYETGASVALELAAILEDLGLTGTVFCLGAEPAEMATLVERSLQAFDSEEALQCAVARHMCSLMAPGSGADVERALRGCGSWAARVDACVRSLLGHVPHSAQYARTLLHAAYVRLGEARRAIEIETPRSLRSQIVFLRARYELNIAPATSSLQRYSQRKLHVNELATPMPHAAADLAVSAIVNSYLDDDILQAFEERNLCDTYLLNADTFMTSAAN